jgi:hypothetical protein
MEALGEQLLREAREGQAEFLAGWKEFMDASALAKPPIPYPSDNRPEG